MEEEIPVDQVELVCNANKVEDFVGICGLEHSVKLLGFENIFQVVSSFSNFLNSKQKKEIFEIFESNMQIIYESTSWGWNKIEREKECLSM